ncbi:hypothetical protein AGMMS49574_30180 [Bacteroidia bacterium]|nr:hypothetical protein AGMMS49574_30180 [Bacteroidia bacterium]
MSTVELELQKASLAREILTTTDETLINNIWLLIKKTTPVSQTEMPKKRKIGILDGKAKVVFHDDWSMTPEELGMV